MATITGYDESLVERDEVLFPKTNMIDTEPFYNNFTAIENLLRHSNQQKQLKTSISIINGSIFNLIQIVEDIGCNSHTPLIRSIEKKNALYHLILKLGGAFGPLVKRRRLNIDRQYFQRWYLDKYPCSASMIQDNFLIKKTTQISDSYQTNINLRSSSIITKLPLKQMDEKAFKKQILHTYGFDNIDTISSISSSRRSSIDETNSTPTGQSTPVVLETIQNSKPKQHITIREYYPSKDIPSLMVNRSISSVSQQTINDNEYEYEEFIHNHPEFYHDSNPEIITKSNPDSITYKQNVSIRYLVPPTPPPPGPLIIREIVPPRPPTPSPLIIEQQDPSPPTPPPLILREAPPFLPPQQETKIINKVLPQEFSSPQRMIIERDAPLPPKPQSIIIEKWLPYKPAPPREIIYERITETPMISEFQPGGLSTDRQRRQSADLSSTTSTRFPIPVHFERQNSYDNLESQSLSLFEQFALSTQRHLEALQAQHQRHMNMFLQNPLQLTTPALIVNHPPVTRLVQREDFQQEMFYHSTFMYPTYM